MCVPREIIVPFASAVEKRTHTDKIGRKISERWGRDRKKREKVGEGGGREKNEEVSEVDKEED